MLPTAIEISGFRSFGSKPVLIDSLKKLNFFVGQNNSGKSNVLRSITMLSSIRGPGPGLTPRSSDFAAGAENINVCLHFPNRLLREVFAKRSGQQHQGLEEIDDSKSFAFPFTVDRNNTFAFTDTQVHRFVLSTGIPEARFRQFVNNTWAWEQIPCRRQGI
jgi:hypothetical protein